MYIQRFLAYKKTVLFLVKNVFFNKKNRVLCFCWGGGLCVSAFCSSYAPVTPCIVCVFVRSSLLSVRLLSNPRCKQTQSVRERKAMAFDMHTPPPCVRSILPPKIYDVLHTLQCKVIFGPDSVSAGPRPCKCNGEGGVGAAEGH